jgi:protein-tyrosine kinase
MENIRQAVERAKELTRTQGNANLETPIPQAGPIFGDIYNRKKPASEIQLDLRRLQSERIVAFDGKDAHSMPFDMLRTEVVQSMDFRRWKTLAVTSPTPSCGKTVTAINLALSIARQPEREVLLVDLDLRKPRVAGSLGLKCNEGGVVGIIEGRTTMDNAILPVAVGTTQLQILPTAPASNPSDLVSSAAMKVMFEDVARRMPSGIVILDLPPILTGHDVISILPHVDCVLLVAAVGTSKVSEIVECNKYLTDANVVRFVLNKAPASTTSYAYY